jgi:Flp pilus assembly protein TadD
MLAQAKTEHRAGRFQEAAGIYRQVLAADPTQVEAQFLLGATCHALGLVSEAITRLSEAVRERPDLAEVHHHLGVVLAENRQPNEAERSIRRALELKPEMVEAHHDLGVLLVEQNRAEDAAVAFQRVVQLKPHDPIAHSDLGAALERLGDFDAAADCFRRAIAINPASSQAHNNLGSVLGKQGRLEEAENYCRRAIELDPNLATAYYNLGNVLHKVCRLDEAVESLRRAIALQPENAESHNGLGAVLTGQGKIEEAFASLRKAIRLAPDHADAHFNYGFALLLDGQLAEGWTELEWRLQRRGMQLPEVSQARWTGDSLSGRTIWLRSEQGLGDTLALIRYVPLIAEQAAEIITEVPRALLPILEQSGFSGLIAKGTPPPPFDVQVLLASLPGLVGTTLDNIPCPVPYLSANPGLVEHWQGELGGGKLKIGIAWQGNPQYDGDRFRSIPLVQFAPLASAGVELISLQKGAGREQLAALGIDFPVRQLEGSIDEAHGAFMDTAAIIKNLDLVVSCDTAVAHLAGALGTRVWLALSTAADWRWMLNRPDTPWYPMTRLFRQKQLGRWEDVFEEMRKELAQRTH